MYNVFESKKTERNGRLSIDLVYCDFSRHMHKPTLSLLLYSAVSLFWPPTLLPQHPTVVNMHREVYSVSIRGKTFSSLQTFSVVVVVVVITALRGNPRMIKVANCGVKIKRGCTSNDSLHAKSLRAKSNHNRRWISHFQLLLNRSRRHFCFYGCSLTVLLELM